MAQIVIDNVLTLTTPKLMMAAIDDNFDELYAADVANLAAATARANHTGTQLASTISDLATVVEGYVSSSAAVAANTAKVSNVSTNLTYDQTATTVTINSSDGTDAVLPTATSTLAGVMSAAQVTAMAANTAKVSNVTTNLSYTLTASSVTVVSSDGTDAVLPTADTTLAGVMSAAMVTKLNTASASYTSPWI